MANVTDPLAKAMHGTNPQNLIEYITRQRIYDSRYWKEECFGLNAADVAAKAATQLKAIGGSFGGNNAPTRFLSLTLKLLQIQPDEDVIDELLSNEDWKYVRALGAFYLRLTGRPAEIYSKLEPLYNDYRPLRRRDPTGWSVVPMDEFIDDLLRQDRVCGIAMPRLPARAPLEEAGYLDGPRPSALLPLLGDGGPLELLTQMAEAGSKSAQEALDKRKKREKERREEEERIQSILNPARQQQQQTSHMYSQRDDEYYEEERRKRRHESNLKEESGGNISHHRTHKKRKKDRHGEKKYGSLFKRGAGDTKLQKSSASNPKGDDGRDLEAQPEEGSDEYWNAERAKLGLKPLRK